MTSWLNEHAVHTFAKWEAERASGATALKYHDWVVAHLVEDSATQTAAEVEGDECTCSKCGAPGHVQVDPYTLEIYNEEVLVRLCEACAQERQYEI